MVAWTDHLPHIVNDSAPAPLDDLVERRWYGQRAADVGLFARSGLFAPALDADAIEATVERALSMAQGGMKSNATLDVCDIICNALFASGHVKK